MISEYDILGSALFLVYMKLNIYPTRTSNQAAVYSEMRFVGADYKLMQIDIIVTQVNVFNIDYVLCMVPQYFFVFWIEIASNMHFKTKIFFHVLHNDPE